MRIRDLLVADCDCEGDDEFSGKNFDHRKVWSEELLQDFAAHFGIDSISYSILSNHYHLVRRSRLDVVKTWSDEDVFTARYQPGKGLEFSEKPCQPN